MDIITVMDVIEDKNMFFKFSLFVIAGAYLLSKWLVAHVKYVNNEITDNEPLAGMLT